jgi:hypothetical protein
VATIVCGGNISPELRARLEERSVVDQSAAYL